MKRMVACSVVVGVVLAILGSSAAGSVAAQPAQQVEPSRFGIVGGRDKAEETAVLGVGWQRVTFEWAAFQPDGPDEFVLAINPDWVQNAGHEITGLVVGTPAWASASGSAAAVPDGLGRSASDPRNFWAAFITELVTTYAPLGVHHWTIYDAPNVRLGEGRVHFHGDVADYAQLLAVAYEAAHAVDPDAVIHVAAADWWVDVAAGRPPFFERLLVELGAEPGADNAGIALPFEVVDVRVYNDTQALWDILGAYQGALASREITGVQVWLETGANPTRDPERRMRSPLFGITLDQQADFLVQVAAISLALDVERMAVPLVDTVDENQPWGLLRIESEPGEERRPAFEAYRTVIELFADAGTVTRYEHVAADLIVIESARQDVYVLWMRGAWPGEFTITSPEVGESATLYTAQGWFRTVRSEAFDWPASFRLGADPAQRDANDFLTVAGSPRLLVLEPSGEFFRVVYVLANGEYFRMK
ncbi:MAG: hypothetical protein GYB65_02755 [Chloroflexi bacterium]|nr:hypothetical protein [Chloroflexota bacterium]